METGRKECDAIETTFRRISPVSYTHLLNKTLTIQSNATNVDMVYDLKNDELKTWTDNSIKKVPIDKRLEILNNVIKDDFADKVTMDMLNSKERINIGLRPEVQQEMDKRQQTVNEVGQNEELSVQQEIDVYKRQVYAINIEHAEHVAEYYREIGIEAVAISSKTPLAERIMLIERFKEASMEGCYKPNCASLSLSEPLGTDDGNKTDRTDKAGTPLTQANNIQVLVNVDLFGEGFDCPDVEFIQLARPTLSLAKYLQMVGRGLRVAKNKECCIILDNVGPVSYTHLLI